MAGMEALHWIGEHWLDFVQSVGIIAGLWFTAYTVLKEEKARKVSNMLTVAQHHREIWGAFYQRPELARVQKSKVNLEKSPITDAERMFVNLVIVHVDVVWRATKEGVFLTIEGLNKDIGEFFSLPIPMAVWEQFKSFHDAAFVSFVDSCRREE